MIDSADQIAAVILAGGLGTRIRHLLPDIPKPMALVMGRPFLEWVVRYLACQGVRNVMISTGYRSEMVAAHFVNQPIQGVSIQCVAETEPLGTAGGFRNAIEQSSLKPYSWLVLNGDSLALGPLSPLTAAIFDGHCSAAILGLPMRDTSRYGAIALDGSGELVRFEEKKPGAGVINAGVYLFESKVLSMFPQTVPLSFEREVFPHLIERHLRIRVCTVNAPFLDIGTPESLPQAEVFIRDHQNWFV